MDGRMYGRTDIKTDRDTEDVRTDRQTEGTDRQTDVCRERETDRQINK